MQPDPYASGDTPRPTPPDATAPGANTPDTHGTPDVLAGQQDGTDHANANSDADRSFSTRRDPSSMEPTTAAHADDTRRRATWRFMLSHPVHFPSLGFGSGLSPIMPGTCGTLFGWATFALLQPWLSNTAWAALIIIGFVVGIGFCDFTARRMNTPDPGAVVWDEVIAIWLVLWLAAPTGFVAQLIAFLVFRFFDMVKPPPIRYFDQHLKGGFGIMFDDIVAAFFSLVVLAIGHRLFG